VSKRDQKEDPIQAPLSRHVEASWDQSRGDCTSLKDVEESIVEGSNRSGNYEDPENPWIVGDDAKYPAPLSSMTSN
jgi:hypothetical protein